MSKQNITKPNLLAKQSSQEQYKLQASFSSSSSSSQSSQQLLKLQDIQALCDRDAHLDIASIKQVFLSFVHKFYNLQLSKAIKDGNLKMSTELDKNKNEEKEKDNDEDDKDYKKQDNKNNIKDKDKVSETQFKILINEVDAGQNIIRQDKLLQKKVSQKQAKKLRKKQSQPIKFEPTSLPQIEKRLKRLQQQLNSLRITVKENQNLHLNYKINVNSSEQKYEQIDNQNQFSYVFQTKLPDFSSFQIMKGQQKDSYKITYKNIKLNTNKAYLLLDRCKFNEVQGKKEGYQNKMTLKYTVKYGSEGVKPGYICLNNKYVNNIGQKCLQEFKYVLFDKNQGKILSNNSHIGLYKNQLQNIQYFTLILVQSELNAKFQIHSKQKVLFMQGNDNRITPQSTKDQFWFPFILFQSQNDSIQLL